jgi:hypothetical protein
VEHTITKEKSPADSESINVQWGWHDIPTLCEKTEEPMDESAKEVEAIPLPTAPNHYVTTVGNLCASKIETAPLPPVKKPRGRPRKNAADKAPEKPKAKAKAAAKPRTKVQTEDKKIDDPVDDPVEAPSHYCKGGYELGPMLYVWGLSHRRASAVEYIMRAGDKKASDEVEDLRKAIRNLQMEIEYMEKYGKV